MDEDCWKGSRATSSVNGCFHIPDPLYLFGYGSLLWKPGELLGSCPSYACSALGFTRVFAQRSCDHRGTPAMPGVVVTLVDCSELCSILPQSSGQSTTNPAMASSKCSGLIWKIPQEYAESLLDELDYREKGGYSRILIEVELYEDTQDHKAGDIINAVCYVGSITNPLFDISLHGRNLLISEESPVVDIIATSVGPSGSNFEYLFGLESFLYSRHLEDEYVVQLAFHVRRRLGSWRGWDHILSAPCLIEEAPIILAGWGSNDKKQLFGDRNLSNVLLQTQAETLEMSLCSNSMLICGGTLSAILSPSGMLRIWGVGAKELISIDFICVASRQAFRRWQELSTNEIVFMGVRNCCIGYDCVLVYFENNLVVGLGNDEHHLCSAGVDFIVRNRGELFGIEPSGMFKLQSCAAHTPCLRLVKLAASVRHCAALFERSLCLWGSFANIFGSKEAAIEDCWTIEQDHCWWNVPEGVGNLVDVGVGFRFTVVLAENGNIWTFGSNIHSALGRFTLGGIDSTPRLLSFQPKVRWNKVSCGWSHTVVRGVTATGELMYAAFGRNTFGQLPSEEECLLEFNHNESDIVYFSSLPNGASILNIWCGSEFTFAVGSDKLLFGRGWNDHSNLGCGSSGTVNSHWAAVTLASSPQQLHLSSVWDGAVGVGGSHAIASVRSGAPVTADENL